MADEPPEGQGARGALLFKSGRAIEGNISEGENHYVVTRSAGRVEIPKSQVELVASDLTEIYRHKAAHLDARDADQHVQLAQWCLLMELHDGAMEQLRRALELDPKSVRARGLLKNLTRRLAVPPKPAPRSEQSEHSGSVQREYRSFQKELTPAMVSAFAVQVQPLLSRGCATAGCHDTAHAGPLALQRAGRPSQRVTQQNLRAVLSQIEPDDADRSPLVEFALRPHGAPRSGLAPGRISDHAYHTLLDWVRVVSGTPAGKANGPGRDLLATTPGDITAHPVAPSAPADGPQEPHAAETDRSPNGPAAESIATRPAPISPLRAHPVAVPTPPVSGDPSGDAFVPVDPFDPEIFNRQFAPGRPRTRERGE